MKKDRFWERSKIHYIPIYDYYLEVIVTNSIDKAFKREDRLKKYHQGAGQNYAGLFMYWNNNMALAIDSGQMSHANVAHEVFHGTHRMLERIGQKISKNHHEAHAYLCGYLTTLVYKDLKKWKSLPRS